MKVLLSIKPEFVERIFSGEKVYEYRKVVFKRRDIESVVIYSTMPEGMIVGEFEVGEIADNPTELWKKTKEVSGITKQFFDEYFLDKQVGYTIEIKKLIRYATPINPYKQLDGLKLLNRTST